MITHNIKDRKLSKSEAETLRELQAAELYIMPSKELNPFWKGFTLIVASGPRRGSILFDQITKKECKEIIKEIKTGEGLLA